MLSSARPDFTINHYIEVLKGSRNQKVLSAKHDQLQLHGCFKEFKKEDIERLLRKMMSEGLIKEEVKKLEFENIVAYIRLGDKAKNFYTGNGPSFEFPVVQKEEKLKQNKLPVREEDEVSNSVCQLAYEALEKVSRQIGREQNMHYHNILPLETLRKISTKMPTNEAEMLKIANVTKDIFDKFGQRYLKVTKEYKNLLDDQRRMQNEPGLFDDLDEDETGANFHGEAIDFDAVQRADRPSTSSGVRGGRTGGFRGGKKVYYGFHHRGGTKKKPSPYFQKAGNKTTKKKGNFSFRKDSW